MSCEECEPELIRLDTSTGTRRALAGKALQALWHGLSSELVLTFRITSPILLI
jgi:hypothetical protein